MRRAPLRSMALVIGASIGRFSIPVSHCKLVSPCRLALKPRDVGRRMLGHLRPLLAARNGFERVYAKDGTFETVAVLEGASNFRLHLYDHCPYCTRIELVLGWRGCEYERFVYNYADVEGPTKLIGRKVLPVLEWTDPEGAQRVMGESKDIINALEAMSDPRVVAPPNKKRKDLEKWQQRLRKVMHSLTRPRLLLMPIADFATEADRQYQMTKYVERGFDYDAALARTDELVPRVQSLLSELEPLILGEMSVNEQGWSWNDLYVLPSLRVLTCVAPLSWPSRALRYVKEAHEVAGVDLYFEHAC